MPRNLRIAALAFLILLACSVARSHSDGIYNPSANNVGNFEGIDSNKASGGSTLACSYSPVTTGTQSVAYTGATPSASGGVPAYTFSETGALPTGLSISSSTGVISGTPSVSGTFAGIQVKVADTVPTTVNCGNSFTLVISPACCVLDGITTGIKAAYSTRLLLTAYAGNAIQVQRISDSTNQNIGFVSNVLDTASLATFCSGTTCKVITWYDQSGGGSDQAQPTIANAPIIYQSGAVNAINTKPAILFVGASSTSVSNGSLSSNPANTQFLNAVVKINTAFGSGGGAIWSGIGGTGPLEWRIDQSTGKPNLISAQVAVIGTATSGISSLTGAVVENQYNSSTGAWSFWIDRTATGTGTNAVTLGASTVIVGASQFNSFDWVDGSIGELIAYDLVGGIPSGSRTSIENNQKAYWGTP